ncbi:MAG: hydrogenase iron-sulfur subunit [Atribacterota bacterium]|nr:hydrogenase iron-sulfur subunit [Atribacterota bacterium]
MKIASIGCNQGGFAALLRFLAVSPGYEMDVMAVPCLGVVSEEMMLKTLESGYQCLLLAGCPLDSCLNQRGSDFAFRKVQRVSALLREAGINRKVALAFVTAEKVGEIQRIVEGLILNDMGEPG